MMKFMIFGEDRRNAYLAELLIEAGWEQEKDADLLVISPNEEIFDNIDFSRPGALIFGGKNGTKEEIQAAGREKYEPSEKYMKKNSIATAEGALSMAISETNHTVCNSDVLVLGYGFLGKAVSDLFLRIGANVTVCCKEEERPEIKGLNYVPLSGLKALPYNIILNTIPAQILQDALFESAPKGAILIELASKPCCNQNQTKVRIIKAGRLPGKFSPYSAALSMYEEITDRIGRS